jgi:hypothetical protein
MGHPKFINEFRMSDANGLPALGLGLVNLSPVIALLLFTVRRSYLCFQLILSEKVQFLSKV